MDRNDVLRHLAKPHATIFNAMKKSVFDQLSGYFHQYSLTPDYKNLGLFLLEKKEEDQRKRAESAKKKSNQIFGLRIVNFVQGSIRKKSSVEKVVAL